MLTSKVRTLASAVAALLHFKCGNSFLHWTPSLVHAKPFAETHKSGHILTSALSGSNADDSSSATLPLVESSTEGPNTVIPPNILGPPEVLQNLKIGSYLNAFRRVGDETADFTIERLGYAPDVFCLRNYLSISECEEIIKDAQHTDVGMTQAETVTPNDTTSRRNCEVAWISPKDSRTVSGLVSSTASLMLSKSVRSNPSRWVEDLQVLKYGIGGEYVLHHDGEPRIATVIYYINGVGGTWFPLARTSNDPNDDDSVDGANGIDFDGANRRREPQNKAQAMDLAKNLKPGESGLLVKGNGNGIGSKENEEDNQHIARVNRGDAIVFYNYCDDGSARLNWRALHCGLPTTEEDGTKWIANHWFRVNDLES
jgi:hypothetical protein